MRPQLIDTRTQDNQVVSLSRQTVLVFDSGIGGLSVLSEIRLKRPHDHYVYLADNAAFPYGRLQETVLVARVIDIIGRSINAFKPDLVVIACNTASTLVLPYLRDLFPVYFVGTVPAIKPAALASRTKYISVLATPGTVARDYTRDLIRSYAANCHVTLVGSQNLASLAEQELSGQSPSDEDIWRELFPCFVEENGVKTDAIVLGCTHYPMLRNRFDQLAPWTVAWIDSGAAIARRVNELLSEPNPKYQNAIKDTFTENYFKEEIDHHLKHDASTKTIDDQLNDKNHTAQSNYRTESFAVFTSASGVNDTLVSAVKQFDLKRVLIKPMPLDQ